MNDQISSSELVLSPRQQLGVFNAQPSRHVRSQGEKRTEKMVRMDQKWTKRQNERSPASRKMDLAIQMPN